VRAGAPPARRWGFHALDPTWAQRLVADCGIGPEHLVVDLGAGRGALTRPLVAAGARVIAVELHGARADALRRDLGRDALVVRCDIETFRFPRRAFRVVANPPYALTAATLRRLLTCRSLERADLLVPRWLARRWASTSPRVSVGRSVPAEAFTPRAPSGAAIAVIHGRRH
jgi:23S rRNA (adenine-N6)-dimethyltransferase